MAPKNKDASKGTSAGGKSKGKDDASAGASGKLKSAQSLNCEKHSKKEEALAKLRAGTKFDDVAREFSEDKARQGTHDSHRTSIISSRGFRPK
ncbi:hypothetical protein LTR99_010600 [Exophiala xenobiotica]|uniref:Peptidylprolyl isomerase n=1 Tax=Vermiconidia calcicola TaxID=1690605 RepID=A0AAV9Q4B5_9PEZI|nr:hypothetical protein LTR92_007326 [Exophiala xenobiotica]KAK5533810.1 hypothetical protein LTR25_006790 [Vermiconidia calcicola]KAK5546361.1 Peptidyl-prolyl cis-trans isomerase pin4 [Chaetothyriales sp. CCFEE 6169]KAK5212241.1 hypothetical protein LTR41_002483 [Exophiala xenobiotica]KAK5231808.1 hypothetical protein LTR47_007211 [Exophiala xenobiotica]